MCKFCNTVPLIYMYVYLHTVIEDGKGYRFVQFFDAVERDVCCMEMNGKAGLGQKLIRVKPAIIPKYVYQNSIINISDPRSKTSTVCMNLRVG